MKKLYIIILGLFFFTSEVFLQSDDAGTTSASFLKIGTGAKAAGMAYTSVSHRGDATSVFYNPAALFSIHKSDFNVSYNSLYQDMKSGFLGGTLPTQYGNFGFGLLYFSSGNMTRTEAGSGSFVKLGEFSNSDISIMAGYGRKINDELAVGATLKGIFESLADKSASAFALDVGAYYTINNYDIGLVMKNLGTGIKFDSMSYSLPFQIKVGASTTLMQNKLLVSLSGGLEGEGRSQVNFGAEYKPIEMAALRLGYRTGLSDLTGFTGLTAGIGLIYKEFRFDYAYNAFGEFGAAHFITLGFSASFLK